MTREFSVVIERDEDGYFVGSVPSLIRMSYTGEVFGSAYEKDQGGR